MLSFDMARKIGINACIDKIGRDFVLAHKDTATSAWGEGETENSVFCFVGVDDAPAEPLPEGVLQLDGEGSRWPYHASCLVSLVNGATIFQECVSPE